MPDLLANIGLCIAIAIYLDLTLTVFLRPGPSTALNLSVTGATALFGTPLLAGVIVWNGNYLLAALAVVVQAALLAGGIAVAVAGGLRLAGYWAANLWALVCSMFSTPASLFWLTVAVLLGVASVPAWIREDSRRRAASRRARARIEEWTEELRDLEKTAPL